MIIASTSTVFGGEYLEYLKPRLQTFLSGVKQLIFIPYARPGGISWDDYTARASVYFNTLGIEVKGIHEFEDRSQAILQAEAIFTGGGNTFLLVHDLYRYRIMQVLREAIFTGVPYLGSSAGSNITGLTMQTTNDMPVIYPPSFKTLGAVPFNINPHYLDPEPGSKHMGETRETRIGEFQVLNDIPVVGLREGSWLEVNDDDITLGGTLSARIFLKDRQPYELEAGSHLEL